ncbi:F-box protein At5g49610-like [Salvia miltiorrhiza]|uniref:F-box protein At5g49610-like n=1 Tax=Salvia miltiorrhiza TaxID=226208 RepID=UPI0025ABF168|nr:F-box protein At5g49610-like [Salvia miltiorrhiza]XP_057766151.1 F-box protein At5g49610-like [Salvia miltiorrhiza]
MEMDPLVMKVKLKDVVRERVLPFLPAKSLLRFMSVSKEWKGWINSPLLAFHQSHYFNKLSGFFAQTQTTDPTFITLDASAYGVAMPNLRFLPEPVHIATSCSGLLVCLGRESDSYYICNPASKAWAPLPQPLLYHQYGARAILAFEPSARNIEQRYQLICAVPLPGGELSFELYSSATKSWTVLNTTLPDMENLRMIGNGLYMKGVAYWLTDAGMVIAYDVERELHDLIPVESSDGVLAQMAGELCYITMSHLTGSRYKIMIHGGMDLSLKRCLEISIGEIDPWFRVLSCVDGETVMILFEDWIYSYSISDGNLEAKTRVGIGSVSADNNYLPYVNTLVQVEGVW